MNDKQRDLVATSRRGSQATSKLVWALRITVFGIVVLSCLAAGALLYARWQEARLMSMAPSIRSATHLNPLQALYLRGYLLARADDLQSPAADVANKGTFVIAPGERADEIAANLVAAGFLDDSALLVNYLRYFDLDSGLEAGTFELSGDATIPELASILSRAADLQVDLTFIEGWRIEEMAAYLDQIRPAFIDPEEFLAIAKGESGFDLTAYDFLASLPAGASLEGFLFPDTYRIPVEADAAFLVGLMLENFGEQVTASMRQSYGAQGLSVYEAVTLASIVQREAVIADERPEMVGVFLNRLAQDMPLQADPTVQYAVGFDAENGRWWKSPLRQADLEVDSPYNTYRYGGLPPGPIANPGLEALRSVAQPAQSRYLFFVVDCDSEVVGQHVFSETFEEHLAHVEACR